MNCPYCEHPESKVIDSRPHDNGFSIRRRRECVGCQRRFTTYEVVESTPIMVVKRDNTRETFEKSKLLRGLIRACEKRPVSMEVLEQIAQNIEVELQNSLEKEIASKTIGEMVMESLKIVDKVAYVRFASVYRQFEDVNSFLDELNKLIRDNKE